MFFMVSNYCIGYNIEKKHIVIRKGVTFMVIYVFFSHIWKVIRLSRLQAYLPPCHNINLICSNLKAEPYFIIRQHIVH